MKKLNLNNFLSSIVGSDRLKLYRAMKICFLVIGLVLFQSCIIQFVNGNAYELLPTERQNSIKKLESFSSLDSNAIYEITAIQLKEELKNKPRSIVYFFNSYCSSDYCVPLKTIEDYAANNNYEVYFILTDYYQLENTLSQRIHHPLFAINSDYYKEKKSKKYIKAFRNELGYFEFNGGEKYSGKVMFFNHDSIVAIKYAVNEE